MRKAEEYYENTQMLPPCNNVKYFINLKNKPAKAVELGCGAGRDTVFLIKSGWEVLAIDKENTEGIIKNKLTDEEQKKFKFQMQAFEKLELPQNNLVVANYSLSFCNKTNFNKMWKTIADSIELQGYFVGNFFGVNDEWTKTQPDMTFLNKKQVQELFVNFEIIEFKEVEKDGTTALGANKHWHIFWVIAKKI